MSTERTVKFLPPFGDGQMPHIRMIHGQGEQDFVDVRAQLKESKVKPDAQHAALLVDWFGWIGTTFTDHDFVWMLGVALASERQCGQVQPASEDDATALTAITIAPGNLFPLPHFKDVNNARSKMSRRFAGSEVQAGYKVGVVPGHSSKKSQVTWYHSLAVDLSNRESCEKWLASLSGQPDADTIVGLADGRPNVISQIAAQLIDHPGAAAHLVAARPTLRGMSDGEMACQVVALSPPAILFKCFITAMRSIAASKSPTRQRDADGLRSIFAVVVPISFADKFAFADSGDTSLQEMGVEHPQVLEVPMAWEAKEQMQFEPSAKPGDYSLPSFYLGVNHDELPEHGALLKIRAEIIEADITARIEPAIEEFATKWFTRYGGLASYANHSWTQKLDAMATAMTYQPRTFFALLRDAENPVELGFARLLAERLSSALRVFVSGAAGQDRKLEDEVNTGIGTFYLTYYSIRGDDHEPTPD